jgi:hypothetical protein
LQEVGKPIDINCSEVKTYDVYSVIPKGRSTSPRRRNSSSSPAAPSSTRKWLRSANTPSQNVGAYKIIDPAIAKKLISFPDNSKNLFRLNGAWYVETSPEGKTNTAQLIEFWNTWIVQYPRHPHAGGLARPRQGAAAGVLRSRERASASAYFTPHPVQPTGRKRGTDSR